MKKILFVFVLVAVIATGTAFASPVHPTGLGIGGMWGGNIQGGVLHDTGALSLKLPSMPVFWALSFGKGPYFGIQGDVYLLGFNILPFMGFYLGVGGYGNIDLRHQDAALGIGFRVPIGLTFQFINFLELFVDVAPSYGVSIWTHHDGGYNFPDPFNSNSWGWPIEIGFRVWL